MESSQDFVNTNILSPSAGGEDDNLDIEERQFTNLIKVNAKFIERLKLDIEEEVNNPQELLDMTTKGFNIISVHANSISCKDTAYQLISLASTILQKIDVLKSSHQEDTDLYNKVFEQLVLYLSNLEGAIDQAQVRLTFNSAYGLSKLLKTMIAKRQPIFTEQVIEVLFNISHYLIANLKVYSKTIKYFYQALKSFNGYDLQRLQTFITTSFNRRTKYAVLALIAEETKDEKILAKLAEDFSNMVLNDKERLAHENLKFFTPFLNQLDSKFFQVKIIDMIEFMLKRNSSMIDVIADTFSQIPQVTFTNEIVHDLVNKILIDDVLGNQDGVIETQRLFKLIAQKINNTDQAKIIIGDLLLKKFNAQKSQAQLPTKQNITTFISSSIQHIKKDLLSDDLIQASMIAVLEHLFSLKEDAQLKPIIVPVVDMFKHINRYSFLNDTLRRLLPKTSNYYQIVLFNELIEAKKSDLDDIISTLTNQVRTLLNNENYKITHNYSTILTYAGHMALAYQHTKDTSYINAILQNDSLMRYLTQESYYVNRLDYFQKDPSYLDAKYHLKVIEVLLVHHYNVVHLPYGDATLRDTLFEYLLNQTYKFREHEVYSCLEALGATADLANAQSSLLINSLYIKVKQVSLRPNKPTREESPHQPSMSVALQVKNALKFLLRNRTTNYSKDEFINLLKIISHPYVVQNNRDLVSQVKSLELVVGKDQLQNLFEIYGAEIAKFSITQRTGILSSNETMRKIGINLSVILASQGRLDLFLKDLVAILDYKPFELITKLSGLFEQEFDRISHYDLIFYSDITKDLSKVFKDIDAPIIARELQIQQESQGGEEEKKSEEPVQEAAIDPAKLQAQLLKAAQAKKGAAAKKGTKPAASGKPQPAKDAPKKPAQEKKAESQAPPMDKEKRNKMDRQQLLDYFNELAAIKNKQIEAVYEIIKRVNKNYFVLDDTLDYLLVPMVRLLSYPGSRFSTTICLHSIFASHKSETNLFKVKNEVVSCLIAISQNRIYIKNMNEFKLIFQHVEANTEYYDKGHIQLLLLMGNAVLKDMSVHLSVKEVALSVIQSFISTDKVNDIDLVRITINMMKSSYNSKNLSAYLNELIKRLKPEHLALILQRLFEYEPIPRIALLKELLEYDLPLFCPVWLSTQIWILQFDEECSKLARRLWNKYGMSLRSVSLSLQNEKTDRNVFYYLRSKNIAIFEATQRATVAAIEIFQNRYSHIIDQDLIEFYDQEMKIIETEGLAKELEKNELKLQQHQTGQEIVADERLNRMAVAEIIKRTAHLVQSGSFKKIFEFFITKGCLDGNETVAKCCMDAAITLIRAKGSDYAEEILKILESYINESKKYSEMSKNQAIIMIGSLAQYLDNTSQKKLIGTFEKMLELLNTPSELIRQSICKVIPQLARYFDDKSRKFLEDNFKILRESQDEKLLRGSAFAVAGIVKGLGLQTLQQLDMINIIQKECFSKHADQYRKQAGIYFYETLSISIGKAFEMHIEKVLPHIMLCISDPKEPVRKAALQAQKAIMGRLSNYAIKQVLPLFLNGLLVENWRQKLSSVEALGNMSSCAPRQISPFLPRIVKGIREVLNDTHEKVHSAALQAIQNIGGVIKCPEIADILEVLVKALSNPNAHLKPALKLLLETSFVHAIDAPSLSLLVPILDSGLMMHDNESKQLASRLMGNICNLTQDPSDLLPYIKILMPAIKTSLFDSIPEIRHSAAKALGSLSSGLGKENSQEMVGWLSEVLHQKYPALQVSERQGAAQGYAEMSSVHGVQYFEQVIALIKVKADDKDGSIRESFRSVLLYLATSFDQFVKYLPELLPIMIEGLSDDVEDVRKVSMKNVKICIKHYGKQAPTQLVSPILQMMFHQDFRVRQSSSILMYQLTKELENDIIKLQPKYISQETKEDILSAMFILRYDIIERVSLQAAQIWKNIIDNQLKIVRQVLPVLVKQVFNLIQNEFLELTEMGLNCMRGIVEKFGEKVVVETIDILEGFMERATSQAQIVGISKAVYNMVSAAPTKLLNDLRSRFLTMMDSNLHHENEEIRTLSGKVYIEVFRKTYEPNFMTQFLENSFLKKLNHLLSVSDTRASELLIETLKFMLLEAPDLKIEDKLIRSCKLDVKVEPYLLSSKEAPPGPLTIAQAKILAACAPKVALHMFKKKFYQTVLQALLKELTEDQIDDEARINEVLITFAEVISQATENEIVTINEQYIADFHMKCRQKDRVSFYVDFIAYYCSHSKVNYEKYASQYLSNVLIWMNDANDKLVDKVIKSFNSIINGLQKENQFSHIPLIKDVIEQIAVDTQSIRSGKYGERTIYRKKVPTIKMLEKVEGVKNLSGVIQNSITHGSLEIRIDSAICFQYLVDFSKQEAIKGELIKICGALIRVVNDKFAPSLKFQIFQALKLLLIKSHLLIKAMAPQLQTTFLKAFSDTQATQVVRKVAVECLVLFLKIAMKIDPIVKELITMVEGDKIENHMKIEAAEILAVIIRLNGKTIQQTMLQQIGTSLQSILQQKRSMFNDRTLANCAVALAFLQAYLPDQKQTLELFDSMDNLLVPSLSLGLKYGVILNGVDLPEKAQLISQTENHTMDLIKGLSGIEELDGHSNFTATDHEDHGKLHGTLEVLGHLGDVFLRRFGFTPANQDLVVQHFRVVNQAQIFKRLLKELPVSKNTHTAIVQYLSEIPVKFLPGQKDFNPELKQILKDGMDFIKGTYLEFTSKRDAYPALANMFMLNYDNFLETNDEKLKLLTNENAREVINREYYKSLLIDDHRTLAIELLFI